MKNPETLLDQFFMVAHGRVVVGLRMDKSISDKDSGALVEGFDFCLPEVLIHGRFF